MFLEELKKELRDLFDTELVQVLADVLALQEPYKDEPLFKSSKLFIGIYCENEEDSFVKAIAYRRNGELAPDWGFYQDKESKIKGSDYT
ncbi:hypothetical protein [Sessilibacter corallicola]|uniref:hypothetical protein n=1 Tax=Sessilibacter corallicola TaxID=2904075 RepID=UPI001E38B976|nr:hypothetical protein [Sessilibacter corallicola]MCE2029469.1 hypothetical protein [Sessilibacter corallicola]